MASRCPGMSDKMWQRICDAIAREKEQKQAAIAARKAAKEVAKEAARLERARPKTAAELEAKRKAYNEAQNDRNRRNRLYEKLSAEHALEIRQPATKPDPLELARINEWFKERERKRLGNT